MSFDCFLRPCFKLATHAKGLLQGYLQLITNHCSHFHMHYFHSLSYTACEQRSTKQAAVNACYTTHCEPIHYLIDMAQRLIVLLKAFVPFSFHYNTEIPLRTEFSETYNMKQTILTSLSVGTVLSIWHSMSALG